MSARYAGGMYMLSYSAAQYIARALSEEDPELDVNDPYPIEDHYIANFLKQVRNPLWLACLFFCLECIM